MATRPEKISAKQETVLDVSAEPIAKTYARAFVDAVASAGDRDAQIAELIAIREEVLNNNPRLVELFKCAFLSHEDRVGLIDRIFGGKLGVTGLNFLKVLSAHGRLGLLADVAEQVRKLHHVLLGRAEVGVRTATPLSDGLRAEILQLVSTKLGIQPVLNESVEPDLIGGVEIRVGDTVYDGTLRTAFAKAHKAIVEHTVSAIESSPQKFMAG